MRLSVLLFFLFIPVFLSAQVIISGFIADESTGDPLLAASIHVKDTYRGTITNNEGHFELTLPFIPAELIIRFIGYETKTFQIDTSPTEPLQIKLRQVATQMREVVVTGEDPALEIMREVIKRKQIWRADLKTYRAEAYTRQRLENDTGIVSITESLSEAFWDIKRGTREIIKYRQQTGNIDANQNFAAASFVPNFYDDNLSISGFDLVGPTHPRALEFYHFKLEGFRQIDDKTIFDISVRPRRKLQPAFVGMIAVIDEDFALIEVDLIPSDAVMFPPPITEFGLYYKQQFSNFGGDFWLPVDIRIEGNITLGFSGLRFPPIKFHQLSRLSNYEVNIELPDSLYNLRRRLVVDSLSLASPVNLRDRGITVPLTEKEIAAYETVDSTMTLEKAFKPTGALARFVNVNDDDGSNQRSRRNSRFGKLTDGFTPNAWYNRADGLFLGLDYKLPLKDKLFSIKLHGGYNTATESANYGIASEYRKKPASRWRYAFLYRYRSVSRFETSIYSMPMVSFPTLLGSPDYHDYYKSEQIRAGVTYRFKKNRASLMSELFQHHDRSMSALTSYSFPGGYLQRINPPVDDGYLRGLRHKFVIGDDDVPFGVVGVKKLSILGEHAHSVTGSDYDYARFELSAEYRFETFLKRRFLPNVLDVKVLAVAVTGDAPVQKNSFADGSLGYFTPFGGFKTLFHRSYEGEFFTGIFWEHNFRTAPFELIGWNAAAHKGLGLIIFGASGKSWMSESKRAVIGYTPTETGGVHHEIGISLNSVFGIMRIDAAFRADRPGFYGGFSLARVF